MLLKIAWRNIWRNKTRSLIVIVAIMLGLWAGVFLTGFSWGMYDARIKSLIAKESSHLQLHNAKFREEYMAKYVIEKQAKFEQILNENPNVKAFSARLVTNVMLASARSSLGLSLSGVDTTAERRTTGLPDKIVEGRYFQKSGRNQILISRKTADKLKVGLHKKVVLTFQDAHKDLVSSSFRVVGIFHSENAAYDETHAFVQKKDLDPLLKTQGKVQEIAVLLKDDRQMAALQTELKTVDPNVKVENWRELDPLMEYAIDSFDTSMQVIIGIIMLALAFGIVNTMLMSVLDRVKEIGMLMAIGLNKTKLFLMIMLETMFLSLIGAPLGMLLAWLTIVVTGKTGIVLHSMKSGLEMMGFSNTVYPSLLPDQFVKIGITVFVITFISAIFPIIKALRLDPAKAIRKI
ncbi:ABC transporter permease [Marinilongibacter aquaticus]|uniref:ABC transporter permease n=1 Tax=Marinilongibacter aquaticus TaxID=2975157 RepID=UPI0021BDB512|nr:FtsX-like permease family protein [Marinilongibacter aquaticus]UBM60358.1 ABC transporter permease [Marinilongibacter aquaticus]